jgi:hypothetical protein
MLSFAFVNAFSHPGYLLESWLYAEEVNIPDFEEQITPFERMCVVKSLREDRTLVAAQSYIADAIGQKFVDSVPLNMEATWGESTPLVPLVCLLSPGSDPTKLIEELAKRKKIKVLGVSMGQGQETIARKFMTTATIEVGRCTPTLSLASGDMSYTGNLIRIKFEM